MQEKKKDYGFNLKKTLVEESNVLNIIERYL